MHERKEKKLFCGFLDIYIVGEVLNRGIIVLLKTVIKDKLHQSITKQDKCLDPA